MKKRNRHIIIDTPASLSQGGRLAFLLKDSALYGSAAALSKAFALITFPLLARHFSASEYGILDYFLTFVSLGVVFFVFGQDSAVARYFFEYEKIEERRQLISQSLAFQLLGLVILLPVLWMSADWLSEILVDATNRVLFFNIIISQLPFLLVINFSQNLLKWTFARARFLVMSLGFTVVQTALLVAAVLLFDVGIAGVLMIGLLNSAAFAVLGLIFVWDWLTLPTDFRYLREMLPFALPYGAISVVGAYLATLERTLTSNLLGLEALGLYAIASKMAMLLALLTSAFHVAWGPFSLSLNKQADAMQTFNWVLKIFAVGVCLGALAITKFAESLIYLLSTERYISAALVVFPLVMGQAIQATSCITEIGIGFSKRSYLSLFAYAASILVTVVGIWLLTPLFGLLGVGIGVLLGHIAKAVVTSWLAQRAYPMPWQYGPVLLVLGITLASGLFAIWLKMVYGSFLANLAIIFTIIIVLGIGWLVVLNKSERQRIFAFFAGK